MLWLSYGFENLWSFSLWKINILIWKPKMEVWFRWWFLGSQPLIFQGVGVVWRGLKWFLDAMILIAPRVVFHFMLFPHTIFINDNNNQEDYMKQTGPCEKLMESSQHPITKLLFNYFFVEQLAITSIWICFESRINLSYLSQNMR